MRTLSLPLSRAAVGAAWLASSLAAQSSMQFNRDIRPVLAEHCFQCHGPDASTRKARLRLDRRDDAFQPRGDRPAAFVPGDPQASAAYLRVTHRDRKKRMPPHPHEALSASEIRRLRRWIEQGAPWAEHWAFVPPTAPDLPQIADPDWRRSGIDRLVFDRLDREGMRPRPAADPETLLRRVTLDLTGLPPSEAERSAFLADRRPGAYERAVDRLLASPGYGEHMARFWLDAARYGDTHGLHLDNYREMWPYRDWVVRAFQSNLPFDQFIVEQLAGDLLPNPTLDQRIATGFNRCHVTTNEGGSIKEEVYVRNVIDRVSTTGTVFLGLTLGCAVCHDHKFDPITQADTYRFFAFFNNLDGPAMDGNRKDPGPVIRVPTPETRSQLTALDARRQRVEARIAERLAAIDYQEPPAAPAPERRRIVWVDDAFPEGAATIGRTDWVDTPVHSGSKALRVSAQGTPVAHQTVLQRAARKLRVGADDLLFAWVYLDPKDPPAQIMLQWNGNGAEDWEHRASWGADRIPWGKKGTGSRFHAGGLPAPGVWTRLVVPAAAVGLRPGMAVHGIAWTQSNGTAFWDTSGIESTCAQEPEDVLWIDDALPRGARAEGDGKTWSFVPGGRDGHPPARSGKLVLRRRGAGLNQDYFTEARPPLRIHHGDRLFAEVWLDPKNPPRSIQLQFHAGSWNHRARWGAPAHGPGLKNGGDFVAGALPPPGRWHRLEVALDDVGLKPGMAVDGWAFTQVDGTVYWDRAGVRTWSPPDPAYRRSLRVWAAQARHDSGLPAPLRAALAVEAAARTPAQRRLLRDHFLRHVHEARDTRFGDLHRQLAKIDAEQKALQARIPTTMVMKERAQPRPAYLLRRGSYDNRGDEVTRQTPTALPPMAKDLPRDRLGLARWLTAPEQPLTARVTVNRFWQQLFGVGLVKTSEDFGNQGARPSHPELLDWLATRFVADGWDVKRLMRRIVTSATYRQSSAAPAADWQRDPENRLLARGPRFRLDAEVIRDQALALSGLLVRKVGGAPVKPPQPDGLWRAVGYVGSNTDRFRPDQGHEKIHRRSLYTFWKRTAPPPQLTTFDAPSREECRVRRERTNTPLQALLLMNDPQFVEAARHFALVILQEGGLDDDARARFALRRATGVAARAADVADVLALLRHERSSFAADPAAAGALLGVGAAKPPASIPPAELAAWTMVANLIFNLDAVVTKN